VKRYGQVEKVRTCMGRKSFAEAMIFCERMVIHSICLTQSGACAADFVGGGKRMADVRAEYVTRRDFNMDTSAGRRSQRRNEIEHG
jgi:hypothetical protein